MTGLSSVAPEDRPPLQIVFQSYHLMIALSFVFIGVALLALIMHLLGRLERARWLLWLLIICIPLPIIAMNLGWTSAEVGRQPWIVQGLLRTTDGVSPAVSSGEVWLTLGPLRPDLPDPVRSVDQDLPAHHRQGPGRRRRDAEPPRRAPSRAPPSLPPPARGGDGMTLADIWFVLVAFLLTGYVILDGFDLGAGVLYPFIARSEDERSLVRASIGPVWDGNEVWLVTGGGALFAAFPMVYAMTFSGFYLAIMLVLFGLILRAVSLEFRHSDPGWKRVWDGAFFLGSLVPSLLVGVALGNVIRGVPMDANGDYTGTFLELLNPYALLVGVTGLFLIVSHGVAWLAVKADGPLHERAGAWRTPLCLVFAGLAVATSVATIVTVQRASDNVFGRPLGWLFLVLLVAALAYSLWQQRRPDGHLKAFLGSAVIIVALAGIAAVSQFPDIVPARGTPPETSLTVSNASSGRLTLQVMLVIALIGVPIVLAYTFLVYRVFWGKVKATDAEY